MKLKTIKNYSRKKTYLLLTPLLFLLLSGCTIVKLPITTVKTAASVTKEITCATYYTGKLIYKGGKAITQLASSTKPSLQYESTIEENHTPDNLADIFNVIEKT